MKLSDLLGRGGSRLAGFPTEGVPVVGIVQSGDWVPDFTGRVRVHVFGGGGAGISSMNTRGAAAGGYCRKDISVTKGQRYACTIGAGGLPPAGPGSASSFVGHGHNLVANGGAPGSSSGTPAGGTASGGSINVTGGSAVGTGGGAIGILGVGVSSADAAGAGILASDPDGLPGGPTLMGTRILGVDIGNLLRVIPRDSRRPGPGIGGRSYGGTGESGGVWSGGGGAQGSAAIGGAGGILGGGGGSVDTGGASGGGARGGKGGNGGIMIEVLAVEGT